MYNNELFYQDEKNIYHPLKKERNISSSISYILKWTSSKQKETLFEVFFWRTSWFKTEHFCLRRVSVSKYED